MASLFDAVENPFVQNTINSVNTPSLLEATDVGQSKPTHITVSPEVKAPVEDSKLQLILDELFGLNGKERYQLWPEKVVREGLSAAHDAMTGTTPQYAVDPATGDVHTSPEMIKAGVDMSALAGSGGLGGAGSEAGVALGSTPFLRPALKYGEKLYKGKEGQQHLDVIPNDLYPTFQKQAMSGEDISNFNFGFLNHKGQFMDREAALKYAIDNGLVEPQAAQFGALTSTLMADSSKPGVAIEAMSNTNKPFYSAVENAVAGAKQPKADAQQWFSFLKNQPGVKQEELAHLGLDNLKGTLTKDELLKAVQEGQPQIKEVIKTNRDTGEIQRDPDGTILPTTQETKHHKYQLPGGPLSRDTEILTNKGWKRIDSIEVGDVVMTRQDEGGILEWQPVQAAPKIYAENLYHFFNQSIDMRVTENHQMVVKKRRRNKKGIFRTTARELWKMSECVVPLTGVWTGKGSQTLFGFNANDIAEFIGWYLSEGSYKRVGEKKNTIQIAQCKNYNPEKCERLEALFTRLGLAWKYYGGTYGIGIKTMNKELKDLLYNQPKSDGKYVPEFFFNESKSVIRSLLDGLILGDGCSTKVEKGRLEKINYFTNSVRLAGDVQALILMIGKRASVRQRPSGLYCVGVNHKEWSSVDDAKYEIASYNDFAYCVTVENHSIYVRRNGVAAFTGNSNYREMLLTLPDKIKMAESDLNKAIGKSGSIPFGKGKLYSDEITRGIVNEDLSPLDLPTNLQEPARKLLEAYRNKNQNQYKSSHWDEPNVLAHIRMNDRTIDGKKSLHLEEIQSDWHQAGRKQGYDDAEFKAIQKERNKLADEISSLPVKGLYTNPEYKRLNKRISEIDAATGGPYRVPDAPFKKTWDELALKKAITEAVKNGYDQISWTPGEAQAARYDLSKQVDRLDLIPAETVHNGNKVNYRIRAVKDGKQVAEHYVKDQNEASSIVGKDVAEKLFNSEKNNLGAASLTGDGLKVGGQGMKAFYDKMLVDKMNALVKKHGGKVEQKDLNKSTSDIQMKHQYTTAKGDEAYGIYENGKLVKGDMLKNEASEYLRGFKESAADRKPVNIHVLKITPELREHVLKKGFPLFSAGVPVFSPVDHDPFKENK